MDEGSGAVASLACPQCGAENRASSAEVDLMHCLCSKCQQPLNPAMASVICPQCDHLNLYTRAQSLEQVECGACRYPLAPGSNAVACLSCGEWNRHAAGADLTHALCRKCAQPLNLELVAVTCPKCRTANTYPKGTTLQNVLCSGCQFPLDPNIAVCACPKCGAWNHGAKGTDFNKMRCQACEQPLDPAKRAITCPSCGTRVVVAEGKSLQDMGCGKCHQPLDPNVTTMPCPNCQSRNIIPQGQTMQGRSCWKCRFPLNPEVDVIACPACNAWNSGPKGTNFSAFTCFECKASLDVSLPTPGIGKAASDSTPSRIILHPAEKKVIQPGAMDDVMQAGIEEHITRLLGPISRVYHEIISEQVHLNVLHVAPTAERNYHTLVTCGMSYRPMVAPEGLEQFAFAELMVHLPPSWPVNQAAFADENFYWPVQCLKTLARFPHEYQSWLGPGHTVPNGNPPKPYANNTKLCCAFVMPPSLPGKQVFRLDLKGGKAVFFYELSMLYREEMDFLLKHGHEKLLDRFAMYKVPGWIDINRQNVCPKKGLWPWGR